MEAAERADRLGADTAKAFWGEFAYVGLGHDFDKAIEISGRLSSVGRSAAAVDLLALYARQSPSADYAIAAAGALEALIIGYESDPQASHLGPHEFDILLKIIAQHQDVVGYGRVPRASSGSSCHFSVSKRMRRTSIAHLPMIHRFSSSSSRGCTDLKATGTKSRRKGANWSGGRRRTPSGSFTRGVVALAWMPPV